MCINFVSTLHWLAFKQNNDKEIWNETGFHKGEGLNKVLRHLISVQLAYKINYSQTITHSDRTKILDTILGIIKSPHINAISASKL